MLLVQSGAVRVECDEGTSTLTAGSLFLAPPGSRPRMREGAGAIVKSISFGRSLVDAFASESSVDLIVEILASASSRLTRLREGDFREASWIFSYLEREASELRPGYEPFIRLKVMELVLLLGRERGEDAVCQVEPPAHFRADDLKRHIEERYAERFSLGDLAVRFGLSPAYLSRAFSKETGYTIVEYLNGIRIRKSCILLKRSRASILDIALSVGYNSLSHFNRYFRRIMSLSPREYRNRSRK